MIQYTSQGPKDYGPGYADGSGPYTREEGRTEDAVRKQLADGLPKKQRPINFRKDKVNTHKPSL